MKIKAKIVSISEIDGLSLNKEGLYKITLQIFGIKVSNGSTCNVELGKLSVPNTAFNLKDKNIGYTFELNSVEIL